MVLLQTPPIFRPLLTHLLTHTQTYPFIVVQEYKFAKYRNCRYFFSVLLDATEPTVSPATIATQQQPHIYISLLRYFPRTNRPPRFSWCIACAQSGRREILATKSVTKHERQPRPATGATNFQRTK